MLHSACTKPLNLEFNATHQIEVWRKLGQVMIKKFFAQTIPDKTFTTK